MERMTFHRRQRCVQQVSVRIRAALLALAPVALGAPTVVAAQKQVTLVVAATTDVHGRIRGWDYYANAADPARSLAGAATIVDSVRAAHPGGVLLVEGGDILQGNPLTFVAAKVAPPVAHPVIAAMNVMRYDAAVLGNHEFNYGVPFLQKSMQDARFPFLAANVSDARGKPFVAPWMLTQRQVDGQRIRIAIVGATTPGANVWDKDNLRSAGVTVGDIIPAVRTAVAQAREKADVVIVLLHSGLNEPATYDTASTGLPSENVAARVPREIPGIDVVVFGHSHREVVDTVIGGALVMQPRNWAASVALGTLTLRREKRHWKVVGHRGQSVAVAGHVESPMVVAASNGTHRNTLAWVNQPVGRTAVPWPADSARVSDMPVTDLVNEVMRRASGADLSATAAFSLDAGLAPGEITQAMLSKLYPYDNTLRAIRITGAQLRAFLEHSARYYRTLGADGRAPAGGLIDPQVPGFNFDVLAGADYTIDVTKPVGQRITRLEFRGRAVQPGDSFTLALNNYRQGGGGGYAMLAGAPVVFEKDVDIRQLIIDEVQKAGVLDPARYAQRNWTLEPAAARAIAFEEQTRGRRAEAGGSAPSAPKPPAVPPANRRSSSGGF
jgi:2',3'-cyclic-nucleotide 2'-phosphodiesterase/3'-nucleotidase